MKAFTDNFERCYQNRVDRCFEGLTFCLLVLGGTAIYGYGQVAQQLLGRVIDTSGAVVANATVTVTNEATSGLSQSKHY